MVNFQTPVNPAGTQDSSPEGITARNLQEIQVALAKLSAAMFEIKKEGAGNYALSSVWTEATRGAYETAIDNLAQGIADTSALAKIVTKL